MDILVAQGSWVAGSNISGVFEMGEPVVLVPLVVMSPEPGGAGGTARGWRRWGWKPGPDGSVSQTRPGDEKGKEASPSPLTSSFKRAWQSTV